MSHGATARPKLSTFAVVLTVNDLDGSAGVDRDVLGFGSDWARCWTGAAERDGMEGAGPAARSADWANGQREMLVTTPDGHRITVSTVIRRPCAVARSGMGVLGQRICKGWKAAITIALPDELRSRVQQVHTRR